MSCKVYDEATKEGGRITDQWFDGCNASLIVCEQTSAHRYIGHSNNLVTVSVSADRCRLLIMGSILVLVVVEEEHLS